jgi:hypothetical protein
MCIFLAMLSFSVKIPALLPEPNQSGQVAQLVEQRTENPCVGGSNPPLPIRELSNCQ